MAKSKIDISGLEDYIKKKVQEIGRITAGKIRDDLTEEAKIAIQAFYDDYSPKYYHRHYYNFKKNSFKKYYANPHNKIYYGGVELTPEALDDLYQDNTEQVFDSVYAGFHGVASMIGEGYYSIGQTPQKFALVPRRMSPSPMQRLLDKRDYIEKNIQDYLDYAQSKVQF